LKLALLAFAAVNLIASCVPNTPTALPDAHLPSLYRGVEAQPSQSLANLPWQRFYDDPVLQDLIAQALQKNNTVQEAYAVILAARANLGITAGNQQPQVGATVQAPFQTNFGHTSSATPKTDFEPSGTVGVSYQIDLFGRLASATAAARAQVFSTIAAQNVVWSTLVSQVASAYFQLLELDATLDITKRTIKAREDNARLTKLRVDYGESSIQDFYQAEQALYETTEQLPLITEGIAQTENALSVLVGEYPHAIARGLPLDKQIAMPAVPATGVPSELLQRRPDVQQAEYNLVAADANIDVARKLLYPSLSLGANIGLSGVVVSGVKLPASLGPLAAVNGVFFGPLGLFSIVPQLTQTIFSGGRLRANVQLAKAQQQELTSAYLQTVLTAFQEVSTNVVAYKQQRAYREQADLYENASIGSTRVAFERYDQGQTSYLEVLNAQTRQYQADIALEQARLNERLALVQLYLSLGGGWQT
jgi:multidrug efflux system outer membrane protein